MDVELFIPDPAAVASERNLKILIGKFDRIYRANCRKLYSNDLPAIENTREILNIKERLV